MLPGPGEAEFKAQVILSTNHPFIYKFDDLHLSASLKRRDADTRPRFVVSRYIDTRRIMA